MNVDRATSKNLGELPILQSLMVAYAPLAARRWHRLCWLLDQRLADVVRRATEPTIAAIRLAWWDAVLVEGDRGKGGGEPLVEEWRKTAPEGAAAFAEQLIDGWRVLLSAEPLTEEDLAEFARKRGGGLFGLLAQEDVSGLSNVGTAWALWDLAAHMQDRVVARSAIELAANDVAQASSLPRARQLKPLRLLDDLAHADIRAKRVPEGFEARHYRRLLWRSLIG